MGWFSDSSSWDPGNWGSIGDVPILGDIHKGIWGDPGSVKAAYDAQIQASKDAQAQMQQFLMGQKGAAQQVYGPLKHMYQSAYGTEGIAAPKVPQGTQGNTGQLSKMYGGR